eukprot:1070576_1
MAGNEPQDDIVPVELGEVVLVKGEKIIGVVSYIGAMVDADPSKTYVGLALSDPVPQGHNGCERGHQYFECKEKHGIMIGPDLVSRRISPPELLQKVTILNHAFKECFSQSQQLKQKLSQVSETLFRVEGENQELREKIHYYEQQFNARYNAPFIGTPNLDLDPSPSPSPDHPRGRSQSHHVSSAHDSNKLRTFNKPLPPLPPHKTAFASDHKMNVQHYQHQHPVVARYKKKSYERGRQRRDKSFKSRRNRNRSDTSKSTLTSNALTIASTTELSMSESPVPLSIGDDGRSFKLLIPSATPKRPSKGFNMDCNESESHDVGDMSFDDDHDPMLDINNETLYTNHSTAARFTTDDDDMTLSHTLYNEENDLDIGSIMSYASTKNIYDLSKGTASKVHPGIIHESPDIEDAMRMQLEPMNMLDDLSNSLEYEYSQVDEDCNLEIESPMPRSSDIHIKVYEPNTNNNVIKERVPQDVVKTNSIVSIHNGSASSIPDNVGLYISDKATLVSDSPPVKSSTSTTISPLKVHQKKRIIKRQSLTPMQIKMPTKFNPAHISKSQIRLRDISDNDVNPDMAQQLLSRMSRSEDALLPHDNLMNRRKSMGMPSGIKTKKFKKRMIRSRTFVSNGGGQKYDAIEASKDLHIELDFEEEKSPQPLANHMYHNRGTMRRAKTPQTQPLRALKPTAGEAFQAMTLDDFALDHPQNNIPNHRPQYNQHDIDKNEHHPVHHKQYYSTHINTKQRKQVPTHNPSLTTNLSQPNTSNGNRRTCKQKRGGNPPRIGMHRTKSSPSGNSRNLGSLTDHELKGFFSTADNLFIHNGYQ